MALTATEVVSVRRYCGFPISAMVAAANAPDALSVALPLLSAEEEAVIRTVFLPTLVTLELELLSASATLNTQSAAVWTRNANEMAERSLLYRMRRMMLCRFLGVPFGAGIHDPILVVPNPADPCGCPPGLIPSIDPGTGGLGFVIPDVLVV